LLWLDPPLFIPLPLPVDLHILNRMIAPTNVRRLATFRLDAVRDKEVHIKHPIWPACTANNLGGFHF